MDRAKKITQALHDTKILLASASERRRTLLGEMGFVFETLAPDVDETVDAALSPAENAERIALRKANAARDRSDADLIIASDTLTAIGAEIIGKPSDDEDAKRILRLSSGARTSVITAICLIDTRSDGILCESDEAVVVMRELRDEEIDRYVASGQAHGKAGAYAIREKDDPFVVKVEGAIDTVMGFPKRLFEDMLFRLLCLE